MINGETTSTPTTSGNRSIYMKILPKEFLGRFAGRIFGNNETKFPSGTFLGNKEFQSLNPYLYLDLTENPTSEHFEDLGENSLDFTYNIRANDGFYISFNNSTLIDDASVGNINPTISTDGTISYVTDYFGNDNSAMSVTYENGIVIPNDSRYNCDVNNFLCLFLIKPSSTQTYTYPRILEFGAYANSGWAIQMNNSATTMTFTWYSATGNLHSFNCAGLIPDQWNVVGLSWDKTTSMARLVINETYAGDDFSAYSYINNSTRELKTGSPSSNQGFDGQFSDWFFVGNSTYSLGASETALKQIVANFKKQKLIKPFEENENGKFIRTFGGVEKRDSQFGTYLVRSSIIGAVDQDSDITYYIETDDIDTVPDTISASPGTGLMGGSYAGFAIHLDNEDSNGLSRIEWGYRNGTDNYAVSNGARIDMSTNHKILCEYTGSTDKTFRIYVDGVLYSSRSLTTEIFSMTMSTTYVGQGIISGDRNYCQGLLTKPLIWKRQLTSDEKSLIFNSGNRRLNDYKLGFLIKQTDGTPIYIYDTDDYDINNIYKILVTIDTDNQELKLYVNNSLKNTVSFDGTIDTGTEPMLINGGLDKYNNGYNFIYSEPVIFKKILTEPERRVVFDDEKYDWFKPA